MPSIIPRVLTMPRVENYNELWASGIGSYWWNARYDVPGTRQMAIICPDLIWDNPSGVMKFIYCAVDLEASEEKGTTYQWDGNEESPTLEEVILCQGWRDGVYHDGWKGYLVNGTLANA